VALRRDADDSLAWRDDAACRGPEAVDFFPPSSFERKEVRIARERKAKAICAECDVRTSCLEHALDAHEPHGVWGGLNEVERRIILDARRSTN
jgi:WhiB family transcriptional regulator, redox-sensing transcriptional regulator